MKEIAVRERELRDMLLEALRELPQVHMQPPLLERWGGCGKSRLDAEIPLHVAGRALTLLVELRKSVYPRDVREMLWQIKKTGEAAPRDQQEDETVLLIAAEALSPGAKELLREERVGYFDTGGSLYIPARGAFFYIDRPVPKTFERAVRSLYTGRRAHVLHALLMERGKWWRVKEMAELAKVSPATASETLSALERFDWVISRGRGPTKERCLAKPDVLLDTWSKQTSSRRPHSERRYYVPATAPEELMENLTRLSTTHKTECVMTQEAAAQRYAPFLSAISRVTCRLMPGHAAEAVLSVLGAKRVSEGANLHVIDTTAPGAFLFKERVGDVWLASPIQVYLDLLRGSGRAIKMAEHLRRESIGC